MSYERERLEKTYEKPGVVWTSKEPPRELVELIESGKIKPCKVLDVGCGEGFYSIYLAKKGFNVTGVDISGNAIEIARENAKKEAVKIRFIAMDMFDLEKLGEKFDFVFEWGIMHGVAFNQRKRYVKIINGILNESGKYLSCSFNIDNAKFGAPGIKIRKVPESGSAIAGTNLYFSSLNELRELFLEYFKVAQSGVFERVIGSGKNPDLFNYLLMEIKK